jgi:hypothetical protein
MVVVEEHMLVGIDGLIGEESAPNQWRYPRSSNDEKILFPIPSVLEVGPFDLRWE